MTAYGQARVSLDAVDVGVEIKTVNGRFLDILFRGPKEVASLEPEVRELIKSRLHRGRVEVYINLTLHSSDQYDLNLPLAANYRALFEVARAEGFEGALNLADLFQLPGALIPKPIESVAVNLPEGVLSAVSVALEHVVEGRGCEGRALRTDLQACLGKLAEAVDHIGERCGDLAKYHREKLREKIARLGEQGAVDESRLAQEVIFYAERADISEELTRLLSHIARFQETLEETEGSLGKKLDFLCQEMNREMNTILSKASQAGISEIAVCGKVEIEKLREQVQNVE